MIQVGIIGSGFIGPAHADCWWCITVGRTTCTGGLTARSSPPVCTFFQKNRSA